MLSPELNLLFEQQSLFRNRDSFWDFAIGVRAERILMHNRNSYSSGGPITAYDDARLGLDVREELHWIEDSFSPKIWAVDPPARLMVVVAAAPSTFAVNLMMSPFVTALRAVVN